MRVSGDEALCPTRLATNTKRFKVAQTFTKRFLRAALKKFKKAAAHEDERDLVRKVFAAMDGNKDGELDSTELTAAVASILPGCSEDRAKLLLTYVDRDQSGHLSFDEFLAAINSMKER